MSTSAHLSATFSLYVGRRFLLSCGVILFALAGIVLLVEFVELVRRFNLKHGVAITVLLQMALLKLPHLIQKVVPLGVLFGGMHTFWRLTRSHELVVARAAGISVWQFLLPAIVIAALIGVFLITVFNPVASVMMSRQIQIKEKVINRPSSLLSVSKSGLWLRQSDDQGQSVIHASRVTQDDMHLKDVIIFLYQKDSVFVGRVDAAEARLEDGYWYLSDAVLTAPGKPAQFKAEHRVKTDWTLSKIQDSFANPAAMSFWDLPGFIAVLENAGFSATRHRLYWQSLLAMPILLCAMVLIASSFSLRLARRGGVAVYIGSGVLFGFLLFSLSDVVFTLGMSASLPVPLAAWTPAGFSMLLGLAIILHLEDG